MPTEVRQLPRKILLIRNDNIGDLICSIPAIQLIRSHFPGAKLHLLVNSYNAPIVEPLVPQSIDDLLVYHKTKHWGFHFKQIRRLFSFYSRLRKERYETVLMLVGGQSPQSLSFARWSGAQRLVGYDSECENPGFQSGLHEVEYSWKLACHFCGIQKNPPTDIAYPIRSKGNRTAIQISSRKPGNRWSIAHFCELIRMIHEKTREKPILLWSPGNSLTPTHPGDDEKAAEIMGQVPQWIEPRPTATLNDLISALQECGTLLTPDGGAMHLAAAMGLRIVAMFGQSDSVRWRPWTSNARILRSPSTSIEEISPEQVLSEWETLFSSKMTT